MPLTDSSDSLRTRNLTVDDALSLGPDTPLELQEMAGPAAPPAGVVRLYAKSDGNLYCKDSADNEKDLTAGAAGGEANTASNVGTSGMGVFKQKTGVDLEFKRLNAVSGKVSVTDDPANSKIDLDLGSVASSDLSDGGSLYRAGGTDVAVADGGTGASDAAQARTSLGLSIGSDVQAHGAELDALAGLSANGLVARTAAGAAAARTITGTAGKIQVSNGDGVAGDPVITIPDSPTLVTPVVADLSNMTHDHQDAAGGGTLDAAAIASGTLAAARLASQHRTVSRMIYIENPTADDEFPIGFVADDVTLVQVRGVTDTGTVDFNIEHRGTNTPGTAGTDTLTSDVTATSAGASSTDFADATVPGQRWLAYRASAVSGSPARLWVAVEYTID